MKTNRKSMTAFINEHKDGLKAAIRRVCPNIGVLTNREIRLWIANDEGLYNWARSEGVRV